MDRFLAWLLFAVVLAMGAILAVLGLTEAPHNAAGLAHGAISGMRAGGDGAGRLAEFGVGAFAFNCLLLLFTVLLCVLGVSPAKRTPVFLGWMILVYAANLIVWWQMWLGHQAFLATGETGWFLGFPTATAWQVYGVWFAGVVLVAVYSAGFRHYILSEDDERRFEQLVREMENDKAPENPA